MGYYLGKPRDWECYLPSRNVPVGYQYYDAVERKHFRLPTAQTYMTSEARIGTSRQRGNFSENNWAR
jgi:hypothetical protein